MLTRVRVCASVYLCAHARAGIAVSVLVTRLTGLTTRSIVRPAHGA